MMPFLSEDSILPGTLLCLSPRGVGHSSYWNRFVRIMTLPPFFHIFLALSGGFLYALGFPTKITPPLIVTPLLGVALFLYTLSPRGKERSWKAQGGLLISFSLGYYLIGYSWLPFTLAEFGQVPFPLNKIAGPFLAFLLIPHYWAYLPLRKLALAMGQKFPWAVGQNKTWGMPVNAACLTLLEYFIPQQFPVHLGHSWLPCAPYLGLAPIFGVPLYSFFSYYGAQVLKEIIVYKKVDFLFLGLLSLLIIGHLMWPLSSQAPTRSLQLRIVQANIGNLMKLTSEQGDEKALQVVKDRYYNLSVAPSKSPLDLIIWPETAMADLLNSEFVREGNMELPLFVKKTAQEMKAEIVTGGYDMAQGLDILYFEDQYNALYHIGDQGEYREVYHKHLLIPFGETMPFGPLNKLLSQVFVHVSFFSKGNRRPLFTLRNGERFIPAICYEILFPRFINEYLNHVQERPHFIINLTNDSWYGDTSEPLQHLFLSRWRALELGLPIIRSTNTGITSILYPDGRESPRMGVGEENKLDIHFQFQESRATPYQRYGILLSLLLMITITGLAFIFRNDSAPPR